MRTRSGTSSSGRGRVGSPGEAVPRELAALGRKSGIQGGIRSPTRSTNTGILGAKSTGTDAKANKAAAGADGGVDEKLIVRNPDGTPAGTAGTARAVPALQSDLRTNTQAVEQLQKTPRCQSVDVDGAESSTMPFSRSRRRRRRAKRIPPPPMKRARSRTCSGCPTRTRSRPRSPRRRRASRPSKHSSTRSPTATSRARASVDPRQGPCRQGRHERRGPHRPPRRRRLRCLTPSSKRPRPRCAPRDHTPPARRSSSTSKTSRSSDGRLRSVRPVRRRGPQGRRG